MNLEDSVTLTGRLSKNEWISLSRDYDIFINTTDYDNHPVSVIEAMALGLPIVTTNAGILSHTSYSDMFMACCFCAYVRKMDYLNIMPLISFSNEQIEETAINNVKTIAEISSPIKFAQKG